MAIWSILDKNAVCCLAQTFVGTTSVKTDVKLDNLAQTKGVAIWQILDKNAVFSLAQTKGMAIWQILDKKNTVFCLEINVSQREMLRPLTKSPTKGWQRPCMCLKDFVPFHFCLLRATLIH